MYTAASTTLVVLAHGGGDTGWTCSLNYQGKSNSLINHSEMADVGGGGGKESLI